jgi:hypothetical protein
VPLLAYRTATRKIMAAGSRGINTHTANPKVSKTINAAKPRLREMILRARATIV